MGLLSGRISCVRYRVTGETGPLDDAFFERLSENRFVDIEDATHETEMVGWVGPRHLFDVEFSLPALLTGGYLVLGLRVDRKLVPRALLKGYVAMELDALRHTGVPKVSAKQRKEITEGVKERLLHKVLPRVQVYELAWHVKKRLIHFCNLSRRANELFRQHFASTFELGLEPLGPFARAAGLLDADDFDRLVAVQPTDFHRGPA